MSWILAQNSSRVTRRQGCTNRRMTWEVLEDRSLLNASFLSFLIPASPPIAPNAPASQTTTKGNGRTEALFQLSLTHHLPLQSILGSHVIKAPMFYADYAGPKRMDLDVIGAGARIAPRGEIVLSGKVLGPINAQESAAYSFLINRGAGGYPGPIKDRPGIVYDAVVRVTTGSGGTGSTVTLLGTGGRVDSVTPLPSSAFNIVGGSVTAMVPASLLPSSGHPGTRASAGSFTFSFAAGVPGSSTHDVAGLAPEYVNIPI
jgi:hypothetical protein